MPTVAVCEAPRQKAWDVASGFTPRTSSRKRFQAGKGAFIKSPETSSKSAFKLAAGHNADAAIWLRHGGGIRVS
jgi:hypothetical protein